MNRIYQYRGEVETFLPGYGIVQPGQEVSVDEAINHLGFVEKPLPTDEEIQHKMEKKIKNSQKK